MCFACWRRRQRRHLHAVPHIVPHDGTTTFGLPSTKDTTLFNDGWAWHLPIRHGPPDAGTAPITCGENRYTFVGALSTPVLEFYLSVKLWSMPPRGHCIGYGRPPCHPRVERPSPSDYHCPTEQHITGRITLPKATRPITEHPTQIDSVQTL